MCVKPSHERLRRDGMYRAHWDDRTTRRLNAFLPGSRGSLHRVASKLLSTKRYFQRALCSLPLSRASQARHAPLVQFDPVSYIHFDLLEGETRRIER